MTTQAQAAQFGHVVLCLISDGLLAGRKPADILEDIRAAAVARPELSNPRPTEEETEMLVRARQSVLIELVAEDMIGRKRRPIIEAKLDLLIQVAKRDALIEAAKAGQSRS